MHKTYPYFTI